MMIPYGKSGRGSGKFDGGLSFGVEREGTVLMTVDLRSDTVTRPSEDMRRCMFEAPVGDDVYGEDPSVKELESYAASLLGKDKGLFVASGTMGNIISLLTHCGRGDGVVLGAASHIYNYEGGGMAALGGIVPLVVDDEQGLPSVGAVRAACRDRENVHFAPAKLLCLENTHNARGGIALSLDSFSEVVASAREQDLAVHVDGARLFNAATAFGVEAAEYSRQADSVNICLSKGLGAPVGSVICGDVPFVERARHWRKRLGGGMRQVGMMAAGGLYALRNHRARLQEDHDNAQWLAGRLIEAGFRVRQAQNATNMVYFHLPDEIDDGEFVRECASEGVWVGSAGPALIRVVTHIDVNRRDLQRGLSVMARAGGLS